MVIIVVVSIRNFRPTCRELQQRRFCVLISESFISYCCFIKIRHYINYIFIERFNLLADIAIKFQSELSGCCCQLFGSCRKYNTLIYVFYVRNIDKHSVNKTLHFFIQYMFFLLLPCLNINLSFAFLNPVLLLSYSRFYFNSSVLIISTLNNSSFYVSVAIEIDFYDNKNFIYKILHFI